MRLRMSIQVDKSTDVNWWGLACWANSQKPSRLDGWGREIQPRGMGNTANEWSAHRQCSTLIQQQQQQQQHSPGWPGGSGPYFQRSGSSQQGNYIPNFRPIGPLVQKLLRNLGNWLEEQQQETRSVLKEACPGGPSFKNKGRVLECHQNRYVPECHHFLRPRVSSKNIRTRLSSLPTFHSVINKLANFKKGWHNCKHFFTMTTYIWHNKAAINFRHVASLM